MPYSVWNILSRTLDSQIASLGTTGLAVSIAIFLWLIRVFNKLRGEVKRIGWSAVVKNWRSGVKEGLIGVGLTVIVWSFLFCWNLQKIVRGDYSKLYSLESRLPRVEKERDDYRKEADRIPELEQQVQDLQKTVGKKPQIIPPRTKIEATATGPGSAAVGFNTGTVNVGSQPEIVQVTYPQPKEDFVPSSKWYSYTFVITTTAKAPIPRFRVSAYGTSITRMLLSSSDNFTSTSCNVDEQTVCSSLQLGNSSGPFVLSVFSRVKEVPRIEYHCDGEMIKCQ